MNCIFNLLLNNLNTGVQLLSLELVKVYVQVGNIQTSQQFAAERGDDLELVTKVLCLWLA